VADTKEIEILEIEAENGSVVTFEAYLRRGGRHFELNVHLSKWEHPDTIADYLALFAELLTQKKAKVNDCLDLDN